VLCSPVARVPSLPSVNPSRLVLLDGFHLLSSGQPADTPQGVRRLVAFLAVHGSRTRSETAGTLWPETSEGRARANLRTALWRLHQMRLDIVTSARDLLALDRTVCVDLDEFVELVRDVLANHGRAATSPRALATLTGAGELLPGWYDDWILTERERIRQLRLHALEALAYQLIEARRYGEAVEAALTAVRLEPLRESAVRSLIAVHLAERNYVEAVRRYRAFREELRTELQVEPSRELASLLRRQLVS
jgi:DNA-binding SARP family transcriptional activator